MVTVSAWPTHAVIWIFCAGSTNERCVTQIDSVIGILIFDENGIPKLMLGANNKVQFDPDKAGYESLIQFLETSEEGKKMAGATGGIQGWVGTLFGRPYPPGGWEDKLVTAFAGTHDYIGGRVTGLYDEQGNINKAGNEQSREEFI